MKIEYLSPALAGIRSVIFMIAFFINRSAGFRLVEPTTRREADLK
ncbi:hypothetical protein D1BOALGB6SA_10033 [Olavius sp. associated proteobacterium Delta 1]|nr:hypothetical protein D1BOALGB6SA_10033 [Olavius sp. associated proteobacterium Delta 1]